MVRFLPFVPSGFNHRALGAAALGMAGLSIPMLGVFRPLGVAPLIAVAGIMALISTWGRTWALMAGSRHVLWLVLLTVAWGMVGASWSINPLMALRTAAAFGATALAGLILIAGAKTLDRRRARLIARLIVIGMGLALLVVLVEILSGNGILVKLVYKTRNFDGAGRFVLNRGATVLAVGVWPSIWLLRHCGWRRWKIVAVLFAAVGFFDVVSLASQTAAGGYVLGGLAALAGAAGGRRVVRIGGIVLAAVILILPAATRFIPDPFYTWQHHHDLMKSSAHHRLTIWKFTGERIAEHPVRGWGLETARDIPGGEDFILPVHVAPNGTQIITKEQMMPLHPHNMFLQWWLELGLPGAVLAAALVLAAVFAAARQKEAWSRGLAFGLAVTCFGISAASYGAWQMWWIACMWLMAAFCAVGRRLDDEAS